MDDTTMHQANAAVVVAPSRARHGRPETLGLGGAMCGANGWTISFATTVTFPSRARPSAPMR